METARLGAAMAAVFLRRLGEHLDHNINIMDREGNIIASRDPARVGTFHAAARHLVVSGAAIEQIEPGDHLPPGTRPGTNLPIVLHSEVIGVVGVTGLPREVTPLAYAVKTSIESMVELEIYKERTLRRRDRKNLLMAYLLYEEDAPRSVVEGLAGKLGYDPSACRAPVLLRFSPEVDPGEVLEAARSERVFGEQDISGATPDGSLLCFRRMDVHDSTALGGFREQVAAYATAIARANDEARCGRALLECYAGAMQADFSRYRGAYRQALWLADQRIPSDAANPALIYDALHVYLESLVPRAELEDALATLASWVPPGLARTLPSTVEALDAAGLNVKEAAARLDVHRNTLAARLDKLADALGADPRYDGRALGLARMLAQYLKHKPGHTSA